MHAPSGTASRAAVITDILRELSRRERLVLALRYTEELTVTEIAAVMEIAATEVERMLDSITERVRRRIAPIYGRPAARRG
ncbi:MAG: Sigma-70, region 4 [Planctomycetota bacterium]|jgi:DNA-directed RNA polymerase specialized sigma subunit